MENLVFKFGKAKTIEFLLSPLFLSFIVTSLIIELTPGPNMAYLVVLSLSEGRKAGFFATLGVAIGLLIIGVAAAFGVATLISNSEIAYQALRFCGVIYLLWLAWDGWKSDVKASPDKAIDTVKFFKRGLMVNIMNPKAAVFYIVILPRFITTDISITVQAITLTVTYVFIATFIHSLIVILASTARKFLEDAHLQLVIKRALSLALAGIAIWFAVETA